MSIAFLINVAFEQEWRTDGVIVTATVVAPIDPCAEGEYSRNRCIYSLSSIHQYRTADLPPGSKAFFRIPMAWHK